jgi:hypothetical protein
MTSQTTQTEYKLDIMQRLGGDNMFDFIITGLVDCLQADPKLEKHFSNFESNNLVAHQKQVLRAALSEHPDDFDIDSFLLLRHYSLIDRGFNEKHFDLVIKHFVSALEDAWVNEDVIRDAAEILRPFRGIFTKANFEPAQNKKDDELIVPIKDESSKKSAPRREKKPVGRSFSGEGLLKMMRPKGAKRTKHGDE